MGDGLQGALDLLEQTAMSIATRPSYPPRAAVLPESSGHGGES